MSSLGDFDAAAVIYGKFTTFRPSTGAAFTLAGVPAISVYKDNSTTESTAGVTLTADFDARTGLNHFTVDTSADGTFYSAGSFFDVVITTGTVDSVSVVGSVVASFTLRKNSALKPTMAGRTLVVDASGLADANAVKIGPTGAGTAQTARDIGASVLLSAGTGTGQLDFTSGVVKANQAQILGTALTESGSGRLAAANKQFFDVSLPAGTINVIPRVTLVDTVTTLSGNTAQTGDSYARIGAAGASLTAIGDTRIANLDATVSSRSTYAGADTAGTTTLLTRIPGTVQPQTGDSFARLGAPAGASHAADVAAINTKTTNLPATPAATGDAMTLTAGERNSIATAHLDLAAGVETGITVRQGHRLTVAAAAGKLDGAATTTVHVRDQADTKNRVTATVDASGNRSAITLDLT